MGKKGPRKNKQFRENLCFHKVAGNVKSARIIILRVEMSVLGAKKLKNRVIQLENLNICFCRRKKRIKLKRRGC